MELSKRALGFLCRQYRIILNQNNFANALGTCALSALVCATACTTEAFMAPMDAMADSQNIYTLADNVVDWTSDKNISDDFFINTGSLTNEKRAGVYAGTGSNPITMTLQSGHTINVTAKSEGDLGNLDVYGMRAERTNNTLINADSIIISLATNGVVLDITNGTGDADSYGMYASGDNNILTNSGTISVTATSTYEGPDSEPFAYGMSIDGSFNRSVLTNDGVINLHTTSAYSKAWTRGMYALFSSTITNNGTLNLHSENTGTALGAEGATAIGLCSMIENTSVNNGTITATAQTTNGNANAYGICKFSDWPGSCTLNNYGTINVAAMSINGSARAYQAYIEGHQDYKATANIGTWTMKLGETYGTQANGSTYYVFGVGENSTLNFGVDGKGADFIISGMGDDFVAGKEYKISDMVNVEAGGTVSGYIASVSSISDLLNVELVDEGTTDDYRDQAIKGTLNITDDKSPVQATASQALSAAKRHMVNISNILSSQRGDFGGRTSGMRADSRAKSDSATMYADANTTVTDAGGSYVAPESPLWNAFLMPFYSTTSENSGAYDTNMGGLVVGASRLVNDDFVFGFHASLSKADSTSDSTDSEAMSYALGINGVYNVDESLYFRGQLTGFFAENDINMAIGANETAQKASANMDTYGMYAELATGYDIALAPEHVLTPELALSYMYAHMEGFDSTFVGDVTTPFSMNSEDYNTLYADASLRWTGEFDLGNEENGSSLGQLKPTVKAGIRQALTDPEITSTMNVFGASATTHADANETSFICEAGLVWDMGDVNTSLTYSGEFGNVEYSHMGMFKVEWEF